MQFQEHQGIATIDDMSGAISAIREAAEVLAARWRVEFTEDDEAELNRILDAADRIQAYHLEIRELWSKQLKAEQGR